MKNELFSLNPGLCKPSFIVVAAFVMAFAYTLAQAESTAGPADSSGNTAESSQQDNEKSQDRKCPRCGEGLTPGKVCRNCGYIFRGSTGGAEPTTGVQNRLKSDLSNIDRTNSNINQNLRGLNNNLRNMQRNIFRIRDIRRRL
jgi:membrane protease subunit (stomatin/prohibitin family)